MERLLEMHAQGIWRQLIGTTPERATFGQPCRMLLEIDSLPGIDEEYRPSDFQELCHPESTYLEKAPAAQLTRIDADDRLFSVPLTRITSVPECAVSSVGFLWGSATVSQACGASV